MRRALITGVGGQDGSYLAELLIAKGYEVHGIIRRASSFNTQRLDGVYADPHDPGQRLMLHYGDLTDSVGLVNLIRSVAPDEVYHLGAQSHVKVSFEIPEYTAESTGLGTVRLLEAIRASGVDTRFYQASSSEMFGSAPAPQSESTPFHPRSPYGCAKVYAYWQTVNYRESYDLVAVDGILLTTTNPSSNAAGPSPAGSTGPGCLGGSGPAGSLGAPIGAASRECLLLASGDPRRRHDDLVGDALGAAAG